MKIIYARLQNKLNIINYLILIIIITTTKFTYYKFIIKRIHYKSHTIIVKILK